MLRCSLIYYATISKDSTPALTLWAHTESININLFYYHGFPFLEVSLPQPLWSYYLVNLHSTVRDHNYHACLSQTPWSIGFCFSNDLQSLALETWLYCEILGQMSQSWVPTTIFRLSEKCDLIQRSVEKFSVSMESRGAQLLWNIRLEASKYRF